MSDFITTSSSIAINDPKLKAVAKRALGTCFLAMQKAVMSSVNPRSFPLPADREALEHVFLSRINQLDSAQRAGAVARVRDHLAAGEATRASLVGAELARLNLQDARSVSDLVRAVPVPAAQRLTRDDFQRPLHGPRGLIPLQISKRLGLRIHKVRCVDETNPEWPGDDEIALAASTIDETGDVKQVAQFNVRDDFDDGEQKVYSPPRELVWFDLSEGTVWPKSYFVSLVLAEKDMGGLVGFVSELTSALRKEVVKAIKDYADDLAPILGPVGPIIAPIVGPISQYIGTAVGWVLDQVGEILKAWLGDDIFVPQTFSASISSASATFGGKLDSNEGTATFRGHGGTYTVTFDWILSPIAGGT